ncbi:MAG: DUF3545 family protein [Vibrionaceae bacterium]
MNEFAFDCFDDLYEQEKPARGATRSKPVKRKWREIEAFKDKLRLRQELEQIDRLTEPSDCELVL